MSLVPKHTYRDTAFVLRTQQLGDADKIVILLTKEYGLVHAVAKSARKSKSKFGARLEPCMLLDVSFVYKNGLSLLNQAMTRQAYTMSLMSDYLAYLVASLLNELIEKFAKFGDYEPFYFELLHGAVAALARQSYAPLDVANAFMLRLLSRTGWAFDVRAGSRELALSPEDAAKIEQYCESLLSARWDIIAENSFEHLPAVLFSELADHVRSVLETDVLTLPLIKKEFFGGR